MFAEVLEDQVQFSKITLHEIIPGHIYDQLVKQMSDILDSLHSDEPLTSWYLGDNWSAEMKMFKGVTYLCIFESVLGKRVLGRGFNMNPEQILALHCFSKGVYGEKTSWNFLGKGMFIKKNEDQAGETWEIEKRRCFSLSKSAWEKLCQHKGEVDDCLHRSIERQVFAYGGVAVQVGWDSSPEEAWVNFIPIRKHSKELVFAVALALTWEEWDNLKNNVMNQC